MALDGLYNEVDVAMPSGFEMINPCGEEIWHASGPSVYEEISLINRKEYINARKGKRKREED